MTLTVGVLASGSGTNLQAILDACASANAPARVGVVICNVPGVRALERAGAAGVPHHVVPHVGRSREDFEALLQQHLEQHGVELLVLAGFMRVLTSDFVRAWSGRLINIHPSLLPSFTGLHAIRQALDYGVRWTGCTVHFVDEGVDTGPIIAQAVVPIQADDTEQTLHARVQREEHRLLPEVVRLIAEGRVRIDGRRVLIADLPTS
ncbi:MAG: phosphoribosylglycinamide formyltransferase [Myxococcales bacterium]|nr:phosphoribosylglycinamide formyltransferase [Myxococcales bacterium]